MNDQRRQSALRILARELSIAQESLTPDKTLREDLGMDSIVALNLIFASEKELGVTIREEEIVLVRTVGDLEELLSRQP